MRDRIRRTESLTLPVLLAWLIVGPSADARAEDRGPAIQPDRVIHLFDGKDLDAFYTWLRDTKHEDPDGVFSVRDGMVHIRGDGYGGLITKRNYRDYHLVAEFKWCPRTFEPRKERARDSGILLHCQGPDGNASGGVWLASIECQIIEGGVGDFIFIGGSDDDGEPISVGATCHVRKDRDGEFVWSADGEPVRRNGGRVNWYGRDPDWQDVLGFRGPEDVDSPPGDWTRIDCVCQGDRIRIWVNGVLVNEAFDATPSEGRILIQSEGAELFFRRIDLYPVMQEHVPAEMFYRPRRKR